MQASASGRRATIVGWRSHGCVAHSQVIAALTGGGSNDVLRAIVNGLSLISRVPESAERSRIRPRANRLVIGATIRWRSTCRQPVVAVIQTRRCAVSESVSHISAGRRIRRKGAAGFLIGPKDRVQASVRRNIGFIFPQRLAAFRLGWCLNFSRSQSPNGPDIHGENVVRQRVEADVKFALAALGGRTCGRGKDLVTRIAGYGRISSAEIPRAYATGTWQQFNFHMDGFLSGRVRHRDHGILLAPIGQRTDARDLRIRAASRLVIGCL